jgi:hypothetical protein
MTLREIAAWCSQKAKNPDDAARALHALARAANAYRPQTRTETYALDEIFESAAFEWRDRCSSDSTG